MKMFLTILLLFCSSIIPAHCFTDFDQCYDKFTYTYDHCPEEFSFPFSHNSWLKRMNKHECLIPKYKYKMDLSIYEKGLKRAIKTGNGELLSNILNGYGFPCFLSGNALLEHALKYSPKSSKREIFGIILSFTDHKYLSLFPDLVKLEGYERSTIDILLESVSNHVKAIEKDCNAFEYAYTSAASSLNNLRNYFLRTMEFNCFEHLFKFHSRDWTWELFGYRFEQLSRNYRINIVKRMILLDANDFLALKLMNMGLGKLDGNEVDTLSFFWSSGLSYLSTSRPKLKLKQEHLNLLSKMPYALVKPLLLDDKLSSTKIIPNFKNFPLNWKEDYFLEACKKAETNQNQLYVSARILSLMDKESIELPKYIGERCLNSFKEWKSWKIWIEDVVDVKTWLKTFIKLDLITSLIAIGVQHKKCSPEWTLQLSENLSRLDQITILLSLISNKNWDHVMSIWSSSLSLNWCDFDSHPSLKDNYGLLYDHVLSAFHNDTETFNKFLKMDQLTELSSAGILKIAVNRRNHELFLSLLEKSSGNWTSSLIQPALLEGIKHCDVQVLEKLLYIRGVDGAFLAPFIKDLLVGCDLPKPLLVNMTWLKGWDVTHFAPVLLKKPELWIMAASSVASMGKVFDAMAQVDGDAVIAEMLPMVEFFFVKKALVTAASHGSVKVLKLLLPCVSNVDEALIAAKRAHQRSSIDLITIRHNFLVAERMTKYARKNAASSLLFPNILILFLLIVIL